MLCQGKNRLFVLTGAATAFLCLTEPNAVSTLVFAAAAALSAVVSRLILMAMRPLTGNSATAGVILGFSAASAFVNILSSVTGEETVPVTIASCGICAVLLCDVLFPEASDSFGNLVLRCSLFAVTSLIVGILREALSEGAVFGISFKWLENHTVRSATDIGGGIILSFISLGIVYIILRACLRKTWEQKTRVKITHKHPTILS